MSNDEIDGLEAPVKRHKGLRVASAAGLALGLAAGGAAVAGATTGGTGGPQSQSTGARPAGGMPPKGGSPPAAVGTVTTVGTSSFTIKTKDGSTVTVDVSGSTTYRDRGVSSPTLANVTVGETVAAFGTETSNTVTATSVAIGAPGGPGDHGGSPPAAVGTVTTVGTSSFTIKTKDGSTVTVDVSGSTTYRDRGVSSPTLANVTVGETVAAFGTETSNTVTATSVAIGEPGGPGGYGGYGGPGGHGGPGGPGGPGGAPPAE